MRALFLLTLLCSRAFANYPNQQAKLLDASVYSLTVNNSGSGGTQPYTIRCGAGGTNRCAISVMEAPILPNRVSTTVAATIASGTRTVTPASMAGILVGFQAEIDTGGSQERVTVTAITSTTFTAVFANGHTNPWTVKGTHYTACADPCVLSIDRNNGNAWYVTEIVDSAGVPLSPRKMSGLQVIPQIPVTITAGSWTIPIEAIGSDGYVTNVEAAIPSGSTVTGLRFMFIGTGLGYMAQNPVDGKCSIKVNAAAWQAITNANVTAIDEAKYYGGIGSAVPIRHFTLPVSDGVVTANATATFGFRFNSTDGVGSGCRFLEFNLIEPDKTITSISVTSNVATVLTSAAHGYSSNNWVYVYNAPGPWGRFNGLRQITVTDTTHFTFVPCTTVNMLVCTSPNGTYTVPTSRADADPTWPSLIQPVAYVARALIPGSAFTEADPTSWTAGSGNAATGETLWNTAALVLPKFEWRDNISRATCGSCHFRDGSDLKALNYSNWSIRQRSIFHGLTQTQGDDIVAYIRGLSTSAATSIPLGRPYNPNYQPAPGLDAASVYRWFGGAGWKNVNVYDNDSALATPGATWGPTSDINVRELAIHYQLLAWNQWLPAIYPGDYFESFNTPLSGAPGNREPLTYYEDAWDNITAGNNTSFANYDNYLDNFFGLYFRGTGGCASWGWFCTVNPHIGEADRRAGVLRPSLYTLALFSSKLWAFVKPLELNRLKDFEGTLATQYTARHGASTNGYITRGIQQNTAFQVGPHFQYAISSAGLFNETGETWTYITEAVYHVQLILDAGNRRASGGGTGDWGYHVTFKLAFGNQRPNGHLAHMVAIIGPQAGYDWPNLAENSGLNFQVLLNGPLSNGQMARGQQFMTDAQRATVATRIVTDWLTVYAKYPLAEFQAAQQAYEAVYGVCCNPLRGALGAGTMLDAIAYMLPILKYYGVSEPLLEDVATAAAAIDTGSRNFNTTDLDATCLWNTDNPSLAGYRCTNIPP